MLTRLMHLLGGRALRQRDLRLLYLSMFLGFLGSSVAFPLRLLYAQAHGATPAELGLMASTFFIAPLLAQIPLGWLVDRWGRVPVLMTGTAAHAVISLLYIFLNSPWDLIALRFVEGITVAAIQPAVSAYIADVTPEEHRAEAYGVLRAVYSGGMLIGPLVGGIIGQRFGFAAAYATSVAVESIAVALIVGRIREPVIHKDEHQESHPASWRDLVSAPLLGAYAAFFTTQIVMGMMSALWSIWVHDLGGSYTFIGVTFTVFALPQIFFGAGAGRVSDRWGRAPTLLISGILVSIIYASYGFMTNLILILLVGIVEGILIIFQGPAAQSLLADASPLAARGRAQGIAGAAGALGGAASAFVSLPLYHYERPLPFVFAGIAMTAGSIVAAAAAVVLARRRASTPASSLAAR